MIIVTKEFWMSNQLSIARFYGRIKFEGYEFLILPPKDDLVREDWIPIYKTLGRERTINMVKHGVSLNDAKNAIKKIKERKKKKNQSDSQQKDFFE